MSPSLSISASTCWRVIIRGEGILTRSVTHSITICLTRVHENMDGNAKIRGLSFGGGLFGLREFRTRFEVWEEE